MPLFPVSTVVFADGQLPVTAEVPTGFVVLQVAATVQELPPLGMVQLLAETERVPDMHEFEFLVQVPLAQEYEQVPPEEQEPEVPPEAVAMRLQLLIVWAVQEVPA